MNDLRTKDRTNKGSDLVTMGYDDHQIVLRLRLSRLMAGLVENFAFELDNQRLYYCLSTVYRLYFMTY
jgi:hypothetical protein